jgi:hypothetical protein
MAKKTARPRPLSFKKALRILEDEIDECFADLVEDLQHGWPFKGDFSTLICAVILFGEAYFRKQVPWFLVEDPKALSAASSDAADRGAASERRKSRGRRQPKVAKPRHRRKS